MHTFTCGSGSSVGIKTGYRLDGPEIESRGGGEILHTCPDRSWGPSGLLYSGYRVFPGVKCGRGVTLTTHLLLVPWSRKSRATPLLPLWPYGLYRASVPVQYSYTSTSPIGRTACTEPQCLCKGALFLFFLTQSPSVIHD